jgi:hypothetical protein
MTDAIDAFLDAPAPPSAAPDAIDAFLDAPAYTPSAAAFNTATRVQRQGATPAPQPSRPSVFTQAVGGVTEPLAKIATSMVAKPVSDVGGIAAMFADYLGIAPNNPVQTKQRIESTLTYEPRTAAGRSEYNPLNFIPEKIGQGVSAVSGSVADVVRGQGDNLSARGMAANAVQEAIPQALGFIGVKKGVNVAKGFTPEAQAAKAQALSSADWQRSAVIDAGNIGKKNKLTMNPAVVNPSMKATIDNAIVNSDYFNAAASINNAPKFNEMVRKELGIAKDTPLDAKAYKDAKTRIAAPYREAANIGTIVPDAELVSQVRNIEVPDLMGTSAVDAGKVKRLGDVVAERLGEGVDAAELIKTTRALRKEAKEVYDTARTAQVDPTTRAMADAKMEIANILDKHLELNASPELAKRLKDSRVKLAQAYSLERATNLATRQVDPMVFAAEMAGKHNLTGAAAEMGQFAANMPEVSNVYAKKEGTKIHVPVRSGPAGTLGFAVGSTFGAPVATSAVSAGIASVGGKLRLEKMLSEAYQAKNATPLDRRIPLPEAPTKVPVTEVLDQRLLPAPGKTSYRPNFTAGKPYEAPQPTSQAPNIPQIGLSEGPVGGQMGALRMEDARVRDLSMRQGAAAEAAAAEAEAAAPRKPASGGMLFDLDPITGKLRAADQGVKGATPEIWQSNTGANLNSAAQKVASGQTFAMTAAEKVAWNKTAVDIQKALPEFKGLSDAQVKTKMADRQWVQGVIDKANAQTQTLGRMEALLAEQLANRTNYRLMAHEIATKTDQMARLQSERARMAALVDQLQETLRAPRPVSSGVQGKKTRAFQKGMLTGENQ